MDNSSHRAEMVGSAVDVDRVAELRSEFAGSDLVRHLASFYETRDELLTIAAAFVSRGLRTGHRCLYLADANSERELRAALRAADVDVEARTDAGDLSILDATEVYLDAGFDPDRMIGTLEDAARESVEAEHPDADITVSGDPELAVHADANLEAALVELLTNAVVHQDCEPPAVSVRLTSTGEDIVRVNVQNPGATVPESDRRALREGKETPLEHGSGLGLWLVKWVTENSGGTLSFPDADATGDVGIRMDLPRAPE